MVIALMLYFLYRFKQALHIMMCRDLKTGDMFKYEKDGEIVSDFVTFNNHRRQLINGKIKYSQVIF